MSKDENSSFSQFKVLDVGCGAGILAESLVKEGGMGSVLGIDPTEKCIELAETHMKVDEESWLLKDRLTYKNTTIEEMLNSNGSAKNGLYDLVCCSEVIEHVNDQQGFLHNCAKLVKPGGHLFLSSIAKTPEGFFLNVVMGEYILGLLPRGSHQWDLLIKSETVEKYLAEMNCNTVAITGTTIKNPITMEMFEIPYLRANYLMLSKKE